MEAYSNHEYKPNQNQEGSLRGSFCGSDKAMTMSNAAVINKPFISPRSHSNDGWIVCHKNRMLETHNALCLLSALRPEKATFSAAPPSQREQYEINLCLDVGELYF